MKIKPVDKQQLKKLSKFLSFLLRHKPETIGLRLDENGWANVQELLQKMTATGKTIAPELLEQVVKNNDKQRFSFSDDGLSIRANQGHSLTIDLDLHPTTPPNQLYHGTAKRNLSAIQAKGLLKQNRHHVHLSENKATAIAVGKRYGSPVVLKVDAQRMNEHGILFYCSANGVWLTDHVAIQYLQFPA